MKRILFLNGLFCFAIGSSGFCQNLNIDHLPSYETAKPITNKDWLITNIDRRSEVYKTSEGTIALSNGLITRTFSLTPNGATIGFDNLITNETILRAVSPEAVLQINGQEIKIGGLSGQPIKNYLSKQWIPTLKNDPSSMKLVGYNVSPLKPRFSWKQHKDWLSQPTGMTTGVELCFIYKADSAVINNLQNASASDEQRHILFHDDFSAFSNQWKLINEAGDRISFVNEGKPGELMSPANAIVFAEQPLPQETKVITCKLGSGTDNSSGYGSGIALQFKDGKTSKLYIDALRKRIFLSHEGVGLTVGTMNTEKPVWLRIQFQGNKMICSKSDDGEKYDKPVELPMASMPVLVRVGKTDNTGGTKESTNKGEMVRSKIENFSLLGGAKELLSNFNGLKNLTVKVHYEMYDNLPLISKWVTIENGNTHAVLVNNITSENLAIVESGGEADLQKIKQNSAFHFETDYAFGGMTADVSDKGVQWQLDPSFTTQVNYGLKSPCIITCMPQRGMNQEIEPGQTLESIRIWELFYDSDEQERRNLELKKFYRKAAPWVTENPIIMHVRNADDQSVKEAIDQSAAVGFEMVIMTFGSGFNIEDTSWANLGRVKKLVEYAHSKNIALGAYSLLASRSVNKATDVVFPNDGTRPKFGNSPCLQSEWGQSYFKKLYYAYEKTGLDLFEHDGSYPGDICISTEHIGHKGLDDSQWKQFTEIRDFYRWSRGKGVYLNVPDWYFLNGSSKIAMGYREANWSLPREYQEIIERQNIYDGTLEKTSSMGWMFVPLVEYHGGGAAATIEPLKDHLPHYEQRLANLFGSGVQACYRGSRLYDAPETKNIVKKWVDFYKQHRAVLDGDIIHIRRPDGRGYDAMLHINPAGEEKGLLMIYNPLNKAIVRELTVDLYYTGLKGQAKLKINDASANTIKLDGTKATLKITVPPKSQQYFVFY